MLLQGIALADSFAVWYSWLSFELLLGVGGFFIANVRDHRHRTDGATDAREAESASGVTAGRRPVDRSVGLSFCCDVFDEEMVAFLPRLNTARSEDEYRVITGEVQALRDRRNQERLQPSSDPLRANISESDPEDAGMTQYLMSRYAGPAPEDSCCLDRKETPPMESNL